MDTLAFEPDQPTARIILNRPHALNAITPQLYSELAEALEIAGREPRIRVIIITGAGTKAFAAGADISSMQSLTALESRAFALAGKRAFGLIASVPQPVIAAINGLALGGGCELALACDLRIASNKAKFGQPEVNLAVIPGGGGTQRLPRLVGIARAKELVFTGKLISAEEALQLGLVNQVTPHEELMPTVEALCRELCKKPATALSLCKTALNMAMETPLSVGLDYEIECFASCFSTAEQKEAMLAFLQKRALQTATT